MYSQGYDTEGAAAFEHFHTHTITMYTMSLWRLMVAFRIQKRTADRGGGDQKNVLNNERLIVGERGSSGVAQTEELAS